MSSFQSTLVCRDALRFDTVRYSTAYVRKCAARGRELRATQHVRPAQIIFHQIGHAGREVSEGEILDHNARAGVIRDGTAVYSSSGPKLSAM
jgi:hypothetical protein